MTQLEHFMYLQVIFEEANTQLKLCDVYIELQKYCALHNADFMNTLHLL